MDDTLYITHYCRHGHCSCCGVGHHGSVEYTAITSVQISGDVQQVVLEMIVTIGILRLFDFNPRRDPDFGWVLLTRLLVMLGIYTVLDFLQFYMRSAVGAPHPEQQTTNSIIITSLTTVVSALVPGGPPDPLVPKPQAYMARAPPPWLASYTSTTHSP